MCVFFYTIQFKYYNIYIQTQLHTNKWKTSQIVCKCVYLFVGCVIVFVFEENKNRLMAKKDEHLCHSAKSLRNFNSTNLMNNYFIKRKC